MTGRAAVVSNGGALTAGASLDLRPWRVPALILGAVLFNAAMLMAALGVIGDLLAAQRTLSQRTFERVRRIELQLGVQPSHYEPGTGTGDREPLEV